MAITVQNDGPALVRVGTGGSGVLESLGYSINGAEITEQPFMHDVFSDLNGGDAGPPIDVQHMGEIHIIRILLSSWDEAVLDKVRPGQLGGTAGTIPSAGNLMIQGGLAYRLLINTANRPRNYPTVIFREPKEINKGTKHSQQLLVATAYKDISTGVLYNATTE